MLQICFCVYLVCPLERRNALAEALGRGATRNGHTCILQARISYVSLYRGR